MSVRQVKRRAATGGIVSFWMVDVDFEHADGRRERVRKVSPVQTRRGAEEFERQIRAALLRPTPARKEVPTFGTFVDSRWWPTYPQAAGNRPTTIVEKSYHLRCYLQPAFADVRLDELRGEAVDRFFASLRGEGLGLKTIKNIRATLRRILASAVEWEILDALPRLPKIKVPEASFDYFNAQESRHLVAAARDLEEKALLLFALHTGARAGEQLAIRWTGIDFAGRQIVFQQSSTLGVLGPTKGGRLRKVPLTRGLERALRAIRHDRAPLVFCRDDGTPLTIWQLHERLWGACRRAGLRKIKWHALRHSFASQLAIASVPLPQIQQWLGHESITTTMRYAHLSPDGGAARISVLDAHAHGNLTATEECPI